MLRQCYNWVMSYAGTRRAKMMLSFIAFAESSFFPIPPDPLYIAMAIADYKESWKLAGICTISSVIGGILGYYIGFALYESLGEFILSAYGLEEAFVKFQTSFNKWGFWIVSLKGLTPIPYKVVTIFSGVAKLDLSTFFMASLIARGIRFYAIATIIRYCGPQVRAMIERNLALLTILLFVGILAGFLLLKFL